MARLPQRQHSQRSQHPANRPSQPLRLKTNSLLYAKDSTSPLGAARLRQAERQVAPQRRRGDALEAREQLVDEAVGLAVAPDVGQQRAHDALERGRRQAWLGRQARQHVGQQVVDRVRALRAQAGLPVCVNKQQCSP